MILTTLKLFVLTVTSAVFMLGQGGSITNGTPSGPAGGGLTGTYPNPTVVNFYADSTTRNVKAGKTALAATSGTDNVAVGPFAMAASTTGSQNVAIGAGALDSALGTGVAGIVALGNSAIGTTLLGPSVFSLTAVGNGSMATGFTIGGAGNTAIGAESMNNVLRNGAFNSCLGYLCAFGLRDGNYNVFLGYNSGDTTPQDDSSTFVSGSQIGPILNLYFGHGYNSTTASTAGYVIHGTGGSGTNQAGGSVTIAGGIGTGTGAGGNIVLQTTAPGTTGTTPNALATRVTINSLGILTGQLRGTTGSIGGGALAAGACTSGTVTVTGATNGMASLATPATYPGDSAVWSAYISAADTVTVRVCALILFTPTASAYNVRVFQ